MRVDRDRFQEATALVAKPLVRECGGGHVAVLVEPLTIAEKAFHEAIRVQSRLPWKTSRPRALVLGAGAVGLLGAMKSIQEGSGNVLDHSMIVYGSGISDGDRHNHDNLPILLCGKGGGTIKAGRHLKVSPQPLNNLFLSMLDRVGTPVDRLGDSTGRLKALDG